MEYYNWFLLNGMILLNVVLEFTELVFNKLNIAVKAIRDSNYSDILVFRNRNESPWLSKENSLPVLKGNLLYSVNDKIFYDGSPSEVFKMNDIIMGDLVDASGGVFEMSEFLHSVKWSSAPSLYEIILVNSLMKGMCFSEEYLSTCVLNVTTLENPSLAIKMNNPLVKDDFISWNVFVTFETLLKISTKVEPLESQESKAQEAQESKATDSLLVASDESNQLGDAVFIN